LEGPESKDSKTESIGPLSGNNQTSTRCGTLDRANTYRVPHAFFTDCDQPAPAVIQGKPTGISQEKERIRKDEAPASNHNSSIGWDVADCNVGWRLSPDG
jgi:hypothetical protein